ncbi:MAG: hypothetical protein V7K98_13290 [Nostoc sp.]
MPIWLHIVAIAIQRLYIGYLYGVEYGKISKIIGMMRSPQPKSHIAEFFLPIQKNDLGIWMLLDGYISKL